eukprot:gene4409-7784_t
MFFHIVLEKNVQLPPKFFGPTLKNTIIDKLNNEAEGQCSVRYGYTICVTKILNIGKGKINDFGHATFPIKYQAVVFKPFKNEVIDCVVSKVTKIGFFADVGPVQIFVSRHQISVDMRFEPDSTPPCFISEDQSIKIQKDDEIRLKVVGTNFENQQIFGIGSIKGDYLGPFLEAEQD